MCVTFPQDHRLLAYPVQIALQAKNKVLSLQLVPKAH